MKTEKIISRFSRVLIALLSLSNYACDREWCVDCMEKIEYSYSRYPTSTDSIRPSMNPYTVCNYNTFCFESRKEAEEYVRELESEIPLSWYCNESFNNN
jgi:hypothetical protein